MVTQISLTKFFSVRRLFIVLSVAFIFIIFISIFYTKPPSIKSITLILDDDTRATIEEGKIVTLDGFSLDELNALLNEYSVISLEYRFPEGTPIHERVFSLKFPADTDVMTLITELRSINYVENVSQPQPYNENILP